MTWESTYTFRVPVNAHNEGDWKTMSLVVSNSHTARKLKPIGTGLRVTSGAAAVPRLHGRLPPISDAKGTDWRTPPPGGVTG